MMDDLSQQELIARLTNYEDAFVERKSASLPLMRV